MQKGRHRSLAQHGKKGDASGATDSERALSVELHVKLKKKSRTAGGGRREKPAVDTATGRHSQRVSSLAQTRHPPPTGKILLSAYISATPTRLLSKICPYSEDSLL